MIVYDHPLDGRRWTLEVKDDTWVVATPEGSEPYLVEVISEDEQRVRRGRKTWPVFVRQYGVSRCGCTWARKNYRRIYRGVARCPHQIAGHLASLAVDGILVERPEEVKA
ncbi:MAG: hypothetical protein ACOC9T_00095 [Myxococcota bacterium]